MRVRTIACLAALCVCSAFLTSCSGAGSTSPDGKTHGIYVHVRGDSTAVQRFSLALQSQLIGTGIELKDRKNADTIIEGELTVVEESRENGISVLKQKVTDHGETKTISVCGANYSAFGKQMTFPTGSGEQGAQKLKHLYPLAKTVSIAPGENLSLSPQFSGEFATALAAEGLHVGSPTADALIVRPSLSFEKVSVTGPTLKYKLTMTGSNIDYGDTGSSWVEGAKQPGLPSGCDGHFADFGNPEEHILAGVAKDIRLKLTEGGH